MRAADTNVVVRLIARDDEKQVVQAERFVSKGAWVSLLVLQESIWVLKNGYGRNRAEVASIVEMMLEHDQLALESSNVVKDALEEFRNSGRVEFSDCLILCLARANGHIPLGSFDRKLGKLRNVELPS
ncbi:MAG: type II toxin-antitoxin system VapC family toxin [Actinomycetes bacterium]|jgi:predicted nucleic-acid-binding protein